MAEREQGRFKVYQTPQTKAKAESEGADGTTREGKEKSKGLKHPQGRDTGTAKTIGGNNSGHARRQPI